MLKKILVTLCLVIALCIGVHAMDKSDKDTYPTCQTQPRVSLFKTALVAFGLMFSPQPVQAQPLTEFGGCYLMSGTVMNNANPQLNFVASKIRTSGCPTETVEPFNPLGPIKDISMGINGVKSFITSTNLCSRTFKVNYSKIMDYGFNMSGNNNYYPTTMPDYNDRYTGNFLVTIGKSDGYRDQENIIFDNTFAKFMNTGICPPSTTSDPQ